MKVTIATPPPVPQPEPVVMIEMSESEAQSLLIICQCIGGHPDTSRRGHFDALKKALWAADIVKPPDNFQGSRDNSVYFADWEE